MNQLDTRLIRLIVFGSGKVKTLVKEKLTADGLCLGPSFIIECHSAPSFCSKLITRGFDAGHSCLKAVLGSVQRTLTL